MKVGLSIPLVAFLLCLIGGDVFAQNQDKQYARAARRTLELEIEPAFSKVLTSSQNRLFLDIDFQFPIDSNILRAVAIRDGVDRSIIIGSGFLVSLDLLVSGAILADALGVPQQFSRYVEYVHRQALRNRNAVRRGHPFDLIQPFRQFANVPERVSRRFFEENADGRIAILVEATAFVIAHEFAHHALGHLDQRSPTDKQSRENETEADRFAMRLMAKSGMNPITALPIMLFFAASERPLELARSHGTHPHAVCRSMWLLRSAVDLMRADVDFQKFLSAHADVAARLRKVEVQLPEVEAQIQQHC